MDGAMGTELMDRGLKMPLPLWSADTNITHPEFVKAVHIDYVNAGADIICTNTFRTTTWTYRKVGLSHKASQSRARSSLMKAVDLARESNPNILAASLTSIEDCYEPSLYPGRSIAEDTYGENINWFLEAGVDVLLFETMGHIEEIEIALETVKNLDYKIWLSLVMKDKDHILSGHKIKDVFKIAMQDIDCLMLNCNTILRTNEALELIKNNWSNSWGVYPNLGLSEPEPDGEIEEKVEEADFKKTIFEYLSMKPKIIGSCCGSSPIHINMIRKMIDNFLYQID
jgi:S-methylmethionine-dependent homocysteine/selenocysteine methylase